MSHYSGMGSKKMAWAGLDQKRPKRSMHCRAPLSDWIGNLDAGPWRQIRSD